MIRTPTSTLQERELLLTCSGDLVATKPGFTESQLLATNADDDVDPASSTAVRQSSGTEIDETQLVSSRDNENVNALDPGVDDPEARLLSTCTGDVWPSQSMSESQLLLSGEFFTSSFLNNSEPTRE